MRRPKELEHQRERTKGFIPIELAKKKNLYSEKAVFKKDGEISRMTMHSKLYDPQAQIRDMNEAGLDVAVLSCIAGWDVPLEDCKLINDEFAKLQQEYPGRFIGLAHLP